MHKLQTVAWPDRGRSGGQSDRKKHDSVNLRIGTSFSLTTFECRKDGVLDGGSYATEIKSYKLW